MIYDYKPNWSKQLQELSECVAMSILNLANMKQSDNSFLWRLL